MALEMDFTPEESRVEESAAVARLYNDRHGDQYASHQKHHDPEPAVRHPKEHMATMVRAAKESNEKLAKKGLPYRFCVCEQNGRIIIDMVLLDKSGKVVREVQRDITDGDFDRLIEDVASIEGLMIDRQG